VKALVEGCSMRSTSRMTGVARQTVTDLLIDLGEACMRYQHETMRDLKCARLEVDEIWSFVWCKQKNVPEPFRDQFGYGDVWTWTVIDADTKLVPCWLVSDRSAGAATQFISDLSSRLSRRVQLSSDGLKFYVMAIEDAFGGDVDYGQIVKAFGTGAPADAPAAVRYSPATCTGIVKTPISGNPDEDLISTSYVERQNLSMRMGMRRFTRLTNGFSKKVENHAAAVALYFMHYNFARIHTTLRVTPAMAAGVTDHVWEIEEIVALLNRPAHDPVTGEIAAL
jgi:IS1 family transposase